MSLLNQSVAQAPDEPPALLGAAYPVDIDLSGVGHGSRGLAAPVTLAAGGAIGRGDRIDASHLGAFILTLQGHGLPLFTLQRTDFPWETWLVIPLSWLLLLRAMARTVPGHREPTRSSLVVPRRAGNLQPRAWLVWTRPS